MSKPGQPLVSWPPQAAVSTRKKRPGCAYRITDVVKQALRRRQHVQRTQLHGHFCVGPAGAPVGRAAQQCIAVCPRRPHAGAEKRERMRAGLTCSRNANAQAMGPQHPSFRRQRASRACESESSALLHPQFLVRQFVLGAHALW
jgi:hypothetical protein